MISFDGPIREITPPHFEEGPWLHKRGQLYYLTYASLDRASHTDEWVSFATAASLDGPSPSSRASGTSSCTTPR